MPAVDDGELRRLAFAAGAGDSAALDAVVLAVRDDVYRLALRMLWHPQDAEDATQEALVRIVTRIASYRGEASFRTWAYRVSANHILNWRQSRVERERLTFDRFAADLAEGLEEPDPSTPDMAILVEEVKLGCTLGMLLCLDREYRLAYVLSEVFDLTSADGAFVCEVSPAAFRKRVSRARARLRTFVQAHCGLVDAAAPCRCDHRVATAVRLGRVDPANLHFANAAREGVEEMERLHDLASLMRSHPQYEAPKRVSDAVRSIIESGEYQILS